MRKILLLFAFLVPLLAGAQIRIQQLGSSGQPAGRLPFTNGTGSFVFGDIDTSKVVGLPQYIIDHTIKSATDSVKLDGSVLKIYSAGSATPTTVDLSSIVSNAGAIDSMKFEASYLKVFQNGASIPDSVLIDIAGTETDPLFSAWDKDYNDLTNTPTITDDQTAAEVSVADAGNHYDGTNVETVLQEIGEDIATAGDNWGGQVVEHGLGLSGNGTSGNPLVSSVYSVNGQTGTVTITSPVTSVNGQTGTVTITATDDQTATEVPISDSGNYFTGTNVESALQQLGSEVASGEDNWGTQVVQIGTGLSGNGTSGSPLAVTVTGNATHSGEVTGSGALTVADNVIDYGNVAATLKGAITDNDGAWDFAASGIVTATISSAITASFTNLQVNKSLKIKLIVSTGGSIAWPASCVVLKGSETIAAGSTYYIFLDCWASDLVLVSITKTAS